MDLNSLQGRVAVLTGAGGGIGRELACTLSRLGMKLVLLGGCHREKLARTGALLQTPWQMLPGDLTDFSWLRAAAEQIPAIFGGVDVLINNAGMALSCPFSQVTEAQYDQIMTLNTKVPFFLTQYLLPALEQSDRASVIQISSVVGHAGYPLQSAYAASKHGLLGFTKSLAREVYGKNIRVHAICPGGVYTDMVKVARPDLSPEGMIQPEEIAQLAAFLLLYRGNAVVDELNIHRANKEPFLI